MRSFEEELSELRSRALLRKLRSFDSPQGPELIHAGRSLLSFASNDYLGLAAEPALREAAKKAIDEFGVGSGAARLVQQVLEVVQTVHRRQPAPARARVQHE